MSIAYVGGYDLQLEWSLYQILWGIHVKGINLELITRMIPIDNLDICSLTTL